MSPYGLLEQYDTKCYLMVPCLKDDTTYSLLGSLEQNDRKCYLMVPLLQEDTKYHLMGLLGNKSKGLKLHRIIHLSTYVYLSTKFTYLSYHSLHLHL